MRQHHTKTKGDLGVLHAIADLAEKGWGILLPMTEHERFDLVAYHETVFLRIQVKYRAAVNGCIAVPFSTSWADRHGTHTVHMDKGAVDLFCVYCPDTRQCYYIDPRMFAGTITFESRHRATIRRRSHETLLTSPACQTP